MKIESRGKYPGVKVHLEPEECAHLLKLAEAGKVENFSALKGAGEVIQLPFNLAYKMGKKIAELKQAEPGLLEERTKEQIAAILAKESEKAALQLQALKSKGDFKEIDGEALKSALLKHAK